jgi:hypothetical protein
VLQVLVDKVDAAGLPSNGNLRLDPPLPGLSRVLLRRLYCWFRAPPAPGAYEAIVDTGAPLTVIPHRLWNGQFRWQPGRDFDEMSIAGVGSVLRGRVLGRRYSCRLARLRVPVELAGRNPRGDRLRLDSFVCQLAESGGPPAVILGLWGGIFEERRLQIQRQPNSDDVAAQLEW